jgi:hypothetical protein
MIKNKEIEKQTHDIHNKLLKKFLIANIFKTINKDNLEKMKIPILLIINVAAYSLTNIINKNKYEFF